MNADYFRTMLDYQYWCRDKLLAATDGMSDEELTRPNGFTYGNILGILAHCLGAEFVWFERMHGRQIDRETAPNQTTIRTLDGLKARWSEMEAGWRQYAAAMTDPEREYVLRGRDGQDVTWKLWQLLTMISTHSKQHGAEAAEALTMAGHSPGDLDFPRVPSVEGLTMNLDYFRTLYDYNYWARDRILAAADGMADAEYQKPNGFTYNGLHSILAHTLAGENAWIARFRGETRDPVPEAEVSTLATLKARWQVDEARMREYLDGLTEAMLTENFLFRGRDGSERHSPLWLVLGHLVNHGTQHRSEAAEALTMVGRSPGALDLTTMYWSRQA